MDSRSLLSILSHVTHGYVGNRATTFPLQYYGWDVDAINTTDFSNHPGYGKLQGTKATPAEIAAIFQGLRDIEDFNTAYQIFMVGYCPNAEVMSTIYDNLKPALHTDDKPVLVVDPVLGDNGRLYVPEDVVPVHKNFLKLGLVDLTTPNQFEMELLTGVEILDWNSVRLSLTEFHRLYHVSNVVILSVLVDDAMFCVGYCHEESEEKQIFTLPIEQIGCSFNGCGDVFTGLLTNEFYSNNCRISPTGLGKVLARLHDILVLSYEAEKQKTGKVPEVVKDVRLISLRRLLDKEFTTDFDVRYL